MSIPRLTSTGLVTLAAIVGGLAFSSAPALATLDYGVTGSFGLGVDQTPPGGNVCTVSLGEECGPGTAGSGTGQFKEPAGIAVNQSIGDVYVVDQGNNRVQRFDAEGNPVDFTEGPGTGTNVLEGPGTGTNVLSGTETFLLAGLVGGEKHGLDSANGIAVDNSCYYHEPITASECKTRYPSNGDVYVIDTGHNVIDKFNEAGEYRGQLTGTGPSGSTVPFAGPSLLGVAVDQEGKIWIYESSNEVVSCNDSLVNECSAQWSTEHETSPGFAVDSNDNVYVLRGEPSVLKFPSTGPPSPGTFLGEVDGCNCATGLAVDGANDLYVDQGTSIAEYGPGGEPFGEPIHQSGSGFLTSGSGIAVDTGTGVVYVPDTANNDVDIFELGEPPEEAPLTEAASPPTATTALLHGTLRPPATKVRYRFEYNTGASCVGVGGVKTVPKESEGAVSEEVKGLQPDTTYKFCLVAENAYGRLPGSEESFTTPPAVEGVSQCTADSVTGEAATLEASLEPKNHVTEYYFQYGTSLPGSKTKVKSSASPGVVTDSEPTELEPNRSYECRLLATREIEGKPYTTEGEIGTFTAKALPPKVVSELATNVDPSSAQLQATIDPENSATTYYMEYVEAARYHPAAVNPYEEGVKTPALEGAVGSDLGHHAVAQVLEGLTPGTTYHFRVVANNSPEPGTGTTDGADQTFTTAGQNPPSVTTGPVSGLTLTGATLSGTVNPEGYATSYVFEIGASEAYGTDISGLVSGAGAEPQGVTLALENLAPDTTYHYRLSATNANGTEHGQGGVFTTPGNTYSLTLPFTPPLIAIPAIAFPGGSQANTSSTETKKLTRAQKLAAALRTCRTKSKGKRAGCERQARKQYALVKARAKRKHNNQH